MSSFQQTNNMVEFDWPEEDVEALWQQIDRAQKDLGKSVGRAVKMAGYSVIRSLGASTAIAPKYREYEEIHETPKQIERTGGGKKYEITTWKGGTKKTFNIRSPKGVRELKRMPQVRIGNRGLAKQSWRVAGGLAGKKSVVRKVRTGATAHWVARRAVSLKKEYKGDDPYIQISNRLNYIIPALEGGEKSVDTAMARAARGMRGHIDRLIKRKLAR